jgi:hypothetical protein
MPDRPMSLTRTSDCTVRIACKALSPDATVVTIARGLPEFVSPDLVYRSHRLGAVAYLMRRERLLRTLRTSGQAPLPADSWFYDSGNSRRYSKVPESGRPNPLSLYAYHHGVHIDDGKPR